MSNGENQDDPIAEQLPESIDPDDMLELLRRYHEQNAQEPNLEAALAAIKLAHCANLYYPEKYFSRIRHKVTGPSDAEYRRLFSEVENDVDKLINRIKANPEQFDRTILIKIAMHELMRAAHVDVDAYHRGVNKAALWEGLHSALGRAAVFGASGTGVLISLGAKKGGEILIGRGNHEGATALMGFGKGAKFILQLGSQYGLSPTITGKWRIKTNARQDLMRDWTPNLAKNIAEFKHLDQRYEDMHRANENLDNLHNELNNQLNNGGQVSADFLQRMQEGISAAAKVDNEIDLTIAGNEQQRRSKGWGAGSNVYAGIGTTASSVAGAISDEKISNIVAGTGLFIQGSAVFTQWLAGVGDKGPAHPYAIQLNVELGDFWKNNIDTPFEQRGVNAIDPAKVLAIWTSLEKQKIEAIQEIYKHKLGKIKREIRRIEVSGDDAISEREQGKLDTLTEEFNALVVDVGKFESFTETSWNRLNSQGVIWQCLNNPKTFREELSEARLKKPGEQAAQISQRYYHALHTLIFSPLVTGILAQSLNLTEIEEFKKIITGIVLSGAGNVVHIPLLTGEVRVQKADNKKPLARILAAASEKAAAEVPGWKESAILESGQSFEINLTKTGGFDDFIHTYWQQWGRVFGIAPDNLANGVKALYQSARVLPQRNDARDKAQKIFALLRSASNVERPFLDDGEAKRQETLMAIDEEVRTYTISVRERQSPAERRAELNRNLHAATPKQWTGMLDADKDPLAVNVRPPNVTIENQTDEENQSGPSLVLPGNFASAENRSNEDEWEASFEEYVQTEKGPNDINPEALIKAIMLLNTGHSDDKLVIPEIEKALGIDQKVADKRNFWNHTVSATLDYLPAALSLVPIGFQHAGLAKNWPLSSNYAPFIVNFAVQLGVIPAFRKRLESYDRERATIQSTAGIPNFNELSDNTPSHSEVRRQLDAATEALTEAHAGTNSADDAFDQALKAKKSSKQRQIIDDIENTHTAAQDYANWLINIAYFAAPLVGHYTKKSLNTFYTQLGANLLTGAFGFYMAGQKSTTENRKKLKAVVEFHECRTDEAIENDIEIMIWDQEKGRLVPNSDFGPQHIDQAKVRDMWTGYCELRLNSVEKQIDGRIAYIDERIAAIHGVTFDEWQTYQLYMSMRCGNSSNYNSRELTEFRENTDAWRDQNFDWAAWKNKEIADHQPLDGLAALRLRALEAKAKTNAMSNQMWDELDELRSADLSTSATRQARLRKLETFAAQSLRPYEWKALEILRIRNACTPRDEELLRARELWISQQCNDLGIVREDAENKFNTKVEHARRAIDRHDDESNETFDQPILDFAYGLFAEKEAERVRIAQRLRPLTDLTEEQRASLQHLQNDKETLEQEKIKLRNNWPDLNPEIQTALDRALKGGFWEDVVTAWKTSSYERLGITDHLKQAYGNNNRFFSVVSHGLPLIADSSLMLWEAMINRHAPESCKEPLKQTGSALAYALQSYQSIKASQSIIDNDSNNIIKRQVTIADSVATIIAGSDRATIIGPAATQIINSAATYLAAPGGTLAFPSAFVSTPITSETVSMPTSATTETSSSILTTALPSTTVLATTLPASTSISNTATSTLTPAPTTTATPMPPPASCEPSSSSLAHNDIPLGARIAINAAVLLTAGYFGSENKRLKNTFATYWAGIKSAETELKEAEEALRQEIRRNPTDNTSENISLDDDPSPPHTKDPFQGTAIDEKLNQRNENFSAKEEKPMPTLSSSINEDHPPSTSTGFWGGLASYVWGTNSTSAAKQPSQEVMQFTGNDREYLALIKKVVKDSYYNMPTFSSNEEISRKGVIRYEWTYESNKDSVIYLDNLTLTMAQTAKLKMLNDLADIFPINGKQARDDFFIELKTKALEAWYGQHVSSETNIKIERRENNEQKTALAKETQSTEMMQCLDTYLAVERFLDKAIGTHPEKKDLATLKFSLIYREFNRTTNDETNSSSQDFKQFLLCYLAGEQKNLEIQIADSLKTNQSPEILQSQIMRFDKLERAKDILSSDGLILPVPISERRQYYEEAYRDKTNGSDNIDHSTFINDLFDESLPQIPFPIMRSDSSFSDDSGIVLNDPPEEVPLEPLSETIITNVELDRNISIIQPLKQELSGQQIVPKYSIEPDNFIKAMSARIAAAGFDDPVFTEDNNHIVISTKHADSTEPVTFRWKINSSNVSEWADGKKIKAGTKRYSSREKQHASALKALLEGDQLLSVLEASGRGNKSNSITQQRNSSAAYESKDTSLIVWREAFPEFYKGIIEGLHDAKKTVDDDTTVASLNESSPKLPLAGGRLLVENKNAAATAIYRHSDKTIYIVPTALLSKLGFDEHKIIRGWKTEATKKEKVPKSLSPASPGKKKHKG